MLLFLPNLKYCCCVNMEVVDVSLLRATLVISPSLFIISTSSDELVFSDFILVDLRLVPITESENNLGVSEPVLDRVIMVRTAAEKKSGNHKPCLYVWIIVSITESPMCYCHSRCVHDIGNFVQCFWKLQYSSTI